MSSEKEILVLGDMMLDVYTSGVVDRISPEAPVKIFKPETQTFSLGGAASVCNLVKGFGVDPIPCGVIGDDPDGNKILHLLDSLKLKHNQISSDLLMRTVKKERLISCGQQLLRIDNETVVALFPRVKKEILTSLEYAMWKSSVLLISDYNKGTLDPEILEFAIDHAKHVGISVIVDPACIRDYSIYHGANYIKPNQREAELASGIKIKTIEDAYNAACNLLYHVTDGVIITLGERGIVVVDKFEHAQYFPITKPSKVFDITGAGDTVLAMLGVCFHQKKVLEESLMLANIAASIQVQRQGVATVTYDEVINNGTERKILTLEQCKERISRENVVLVNGCFDLLHIGHITHLQEAAKLGNKLVVAINSDASVKKLKGNFRPIISQNERARTLASLEFVDYVVIFDEDTPHNVIKTLKPDILAKGTGFLDDVVGKELVESYGGEVKVTLQHYDISTTGLINKVRELSNV